MKVVALWLLKLLVLVIALFYLEKTVDYAELSQTVYSLNHDALIIFFVISLLHRTIYAWRVCYIADFFASKGSLNLLHSFRALIFSELVSVVLPTSYSGEVARIFKLKEVEIGLKQASYIVFVDRLSGLFFLTLISLLVLILFEQNFIKLIHEDHVILFYALTLIGLISTLVFRKKVAYYFQLLFESRHRALVGKVSFLSIMVVLLATLLFVMAFEASNVEISLASVIVILFLSYVAKVIPISVAGVGASEVAFVALCLFIGIDKEAALVTVLLILSSKYLFSVLSVFLEIGCDGKEMLKVSFKQSMNKTNKTEI